MGEWINTPSRRSPRNLYRFFQITRWVRPLKWRHRLNGHEFKQTLGDREGQGNLECCSPWGHKGSDTTEQLSNNRTGTRRETAHGAGTRSRHTGQAHGAGTWRETAHRAGTRGLPSQGDNTTWGNRRGAEERGLGQTIELSTRCGTAR